MHSSWSELPDARNSASNTTVTVRSTGCMELDGLFFHSRLPMGSVIEILGDSNTFKTNLCLSAAIASAACGSSVVYVDSNNSLSKDVIRLTTLAAITSFDSQGENGTLADAILNRLRIVPVFDLWGLFDAISIAAACNDGDVLLIVDSLTSILGSLADGSAMAGANQNRRISFSTTTSTTKMVPVVTLEPIISQLCLAFKRIAAVGGTVILTSTRGGLTQGPHSHSQSLLPLLYIIKDSVDVSIEMHREEKAEMDISLTEESQQRLQPSPSLSSLSMRAVVNLRPPYHCHLPNSCVLVYSSLFRLHPHTESSLLLFPSSNSSLPPSQSATVPVVASSSVADRQREQIQTHTRSNS